MEQPRQSTVWMGDFGRDYTDRTTRGVDEMDAMYLDITGFTRSEMNERFLGDLDRDARILEVGSNIGLQLALLQKQGFTNLYGIELQPYAVEKAHTLFPSLNVIQSAATEIPFQSGWFDVVFTAGVLIHIPPTDLPTVIREMARCSKRYVYGYEYHANELQTVNYRGHDELLWKRDFAAAFVQEAPELTLVKQEVYTRLDNGMMDSAYLLEKRS